MLEPAVIVLRLAQYLGAMVLMGSSLFFVYALPGRGDGSAAEAPWASRLLACAGTLLAATALLSILGQASILSGSFSEGLKPETLSAVATGMDLGKAAIIRAAAAGLAVLLILVLKPSRTTWIVAATLGAIATASLAWMGHGAATEGVGASLHLVSDILHAWAAAVWIGALVAFLLLLRTPTPTPAAMGALHRALHGFSGVGTAVVAVLLATGAINGWFLVGLDHLNGLWTTAYGRLLSLKLVLFVVMLGLAAANRFQLTPALGRGLGAQDSEGAALDHLRRSVILETALGFGVLALVAWFGTLAPPAAM
ncbi:MAG: copper homeostasis membrane protein CopD [Phenylobacterium sp.]|uniref:copper homeostasis membrane protein CopD n=1 Tax=Phenylobacterium sp. TaxID=1871053 RepID=UPI001A2DA403|nr:copper homeostasis membrane protein CopD [Phenylobacterium sp.]MBJ7410572.1 copper homeostasis membrane protein CopD [Phenylobacterium sp.]